jgi:hypothetical protein
MAGPLLSLRDRLGVQALPLDPDDTARLGKELLGQFGAGPGEAAPLC